MPLLFFCLFFIMRPEGILIKKRRNLDFNMQSLTIVNTLFE